MSRKPIISGNWKMNLNHYEAIQLVQKLTYQLDVEDVEEVEITLHPCFTSIRSVQTIIDADKLKFGLGAQNCHWQDSGAYTGEVSAAMLAKLGVEYVICGHSERRQIFGESDEDVNEKVKAVFKYGMTPILAVGETAEEYADERSAEVVMEQLETGLKGAGGPRVAEMVIAYEPVWAIGTGETATPDYAQTMASLIRAGIAKLKGKEAAAKVRIQYGGSVNQANIFDLMAQPDIDGALVGGASLSAETFAHIIQYRHQG